MTWGGWFLVFTLAGHAHAFGPFLSLDRCEAAIQNAREVAGIDPWSLGWRIPDAPAEGQPDPVRCERRA